MLRRVVLRAARVPASRPLNTPKTTAAALRRQLSMPAKPAEYLPAPHVAAPPPAKPIDFDMQSRVEGAESQVVMVDIEPDQVLRAEAGNLVYMTDGIEMDTNTGGGVRSMFTRVLTGQNMFVTDFRYTGTTKGTVALGTDLPSKIIRLALADYGGAVIAQKGAFIAGSHTITIETAFTKMLAGFFGGEGFILQKLSGDGDAFVKASGTLIRKELEPGETLRVASGSIVAFSASIQYDVQTVPGFKNAVFGGQGVFITTLTGPGTVFLQGLPPDRMLAEIARRVPAGGGFGMPIIMGGGGGGGGEGTTDGAAEGGADAAAGAGAGEAGEAALGANAAEAAMQTSRDNSGAVAGAAGMAAADTAGFTGGGSADDLFGDAAPTNPAEPASDDAFARSGGGETVGGGEDLWKEDSFKDDAASGSGDLGGGVSEGGGGDSGGGGGFFSSLWDIVSGNDDDD